MTRMSVDERLIQPKPYLMANVRLQGVVRKALSRARENGQKLVRDVISEAVEAQLSGVVQHLKSAGFIPAALMPMGSSLCIGIKAFRELETAARETGSDLGTLIRCCLVLNLQVRQDPLLPFK